MLASWPSLGSLAATLGSGYLLARLYAVRDRPGARWFLLTVAVQTVMCGAYTVGLALPPGLGGLRWFLEVVTVAALFSLGVPFLGFALTYTGRGDLVGEWWFRVLLATQAVTAAVLVTNPFHGLFWTDFAVASVFGATGATYTFGPWAFVGAAVTTVTVAAASALLFDAVFSYGPLYRREAFAVGASAVPPALGVLAWLLRFGPDPALNPTPLLFLPHVALDTYAFVGKGMFEFLPATRRAAEQSAIEALATPVVVVDERGRVVQTNEAAEPLFADPGQVRTRQLGTVLGADVDPAGGPQRLSLSVGATTREYRVTPAPLADPEGGLLGHTLVFEDVTEAVRREQRLSVLNRVLRHNLRNDLSVATGYVEMSAERVEDATVREMLEKTNDTLTGLVDTGEKARLVERTVDRADADPVPVDVAALAGEVVADARDRFPGATVSLSVDAGADETVTVASNPSLLEAVVENLVENACEHGGEAPTVTVTVARVAGGATVTVADDGPGVPERELEALSVDEETDLEHGSGLGLWLVSWGAELLGAELSFETADGTTATLRVPDAGEDSGAVPDPPAPDIEGGSDSDHDAGTDPSRAAPDPPPTADGGRSEPD